MYYPPRFPICATCTGTNRVTKIHVEDDFLSNRVAFAKGCSCDILPLICHRCRSQSSKKDDALCRWCRKKGDCWTIRPDEDKEIWNRTIPVARKWHQLRMMQTRTQQVHRISKCWTRFVKFYGIFSMSPITTMRWLHSQMFIEPKFKMTYPVGYNMLPLRQSFVFQMTIISFARMLVCKLLNESGNHVMFRQGYCRKFLPFFQQKMFAKILRHVISNIVHLHELSIELHKQ
jgi:hypothetical protein